MFMKALNYSPLATHPCHRTLRIIKKTSSERDNTTNRGSFNTANECYAMVPCSPNDPFIWWGSMEPIPPIGPSGPGPIGNCEYTNVCLGSGHLLQRYHWNILKHVTGKVDGFISVNAFITVWGKLNSIKVNDQAQLIKRFKLKKCVN